MCSAYVWPRSVQGQGCNLRINIVWLYFVSALYLLKSWCDLQITLHKCQVWWDDVQCLCLTKVGSRSRSQFKIKQCMTVFRLRSISLEPLVGFTNNFAQLSSMMSRCAVPMFDQGGVKVKGQNLRLNIVWLYFMSALYILNIWLDLQITLHKCQEWCDDVQCQCLFKVKVTV